jgi:uncharacterized protein
VAVSPHNSRYLIKDDHTPSYPRFRAIDAHNHLWRRNNAETVAKTLDDVGVSLYCDLTANLEIEFADGGYVQRPSDIEEYFKVAKSWGNRFYCFTMADFARPVEEPLYADAGTFADQCSKTLTDHVHRGAKGLKILKEVGLLYRDSDGILICIDDEALSPIWETAADLGIPVLMHQSDPYGFFERSTPVNEHYETLSKYPAWSFSDSRFPGKLELLERRDRLVRRHPRTTFILPHFANYAENIPYVSRLLEENPNVYIDFSARIDELGRQPYTTREFFIRYQDRILFGTDMPADLESSVDMYRCYFRFLETFDEGFYAPDYDGTFSRARWTICGIGLPDDVLKKVYYQNVINIMPSLKPLHEAASTPGETL